MDIQEQQLLQNIQTTFSHRKRTMVEYTVRQNQQSDYDDVKKLMEKQWFEVNGDFLERYCCLSFLTAENFKYYFPAVMSISIQEQNPNSLAVSHVISNLDRPPSITNWDEGFSSQYLGFNFAEYEVIKEWLYWLGKNLPDCETDSILRCIITVDLLKEQTNDNAN